MHEVKSLSHAFGREEEGTVLCNIEPRLTRNLFECILYFYDEICGIRESIPRFLKNAFHIPEECHLGLASLKYVSMKLFVEYSMEASLHIELF